MKPLSDTIASNFVQNFRDFGKRVHELAGKLSDEQFWTKPYPYGNSFGNLVLHVTGNLNHFIGALIAGTGYVRDREREFTDRPGPKMPVLAALDAAVATVISSLEKQSDADWSKPYDAAGTEVHDRFGIYLRCAVHFHHHIGQMIYLVKELTK
ncbi:MAG TPA: DUF1572 family protein [Fimbriiglobus sp.]